MSAEPRRTAPGWHGKLPTLGDFASRGLSPDFLEAWDAWLAEGLAHLQQHRGAAWLQAYLDSPSWRFLLLPGVLPGALGEQAWAGVLMPSVDRVGRYFPFTIAQPLAALPVSLQACQALSHWLDRLDELAVAALYDDWDVERLEQALHLEPPPVLAGGQDEGMGGLLAGRALAALGLHEQGLALWLAQGRDGGPPRAQATRGLPRAEAIAALLGTGPPP